MPTPWDTNNPNWTVKSIGDLQTAVEMNVVIQALKQNAEVLERLVNNVSPQTDLLTTAQLVRPAINELFATLNGFLDGVFDWVAYKKDIIIPATTWNLPAMQKGEGMILNFVNDKGIAQPNATTWVGGYSGINCGHGTFIRCLVDSAGGAYSDVGFKYHIWNTKTETLIFYYGVSVIRPAEGAAGIIYYDTVEHETYIWNPITEEYDFWGTVVEGEFISDTEFEDTLGNPISPDGTKLYVDVTIDPNIVYKWNGAVYVPLNESPAPEIVWYDAISSELAPFTAYISKTTGEAFMRGPSGAPMKIAEWIKKITDTATGVSVDGGVTLSDFGGTPVNGQLYRTGNVLKFKDGAGNVHILNDEKMTISISPFDEDIEVMDCQPISFTFPFQIVDANIGVGTAPSGADIKVGIKKGATDVTPSTRITIPNGSINSVGATPPVFTSSSFAVGDIFKPYIAQVGSTTPGKDLHLTLTIRKL